MLYHVVLLKTISTSKARDVPKLRRAALALSLPNRVKRKIATSIRYSPVPRGSQQASDNAPFRPPKIRHTLLTFNEY